jgi:DNA-binding response OmpR family regulator
MMRSILSISSNKVLNDVLLTIVSGKYVLIPLSNVFQGLHELKQKETIHLVLIDMDGQHSTCIDFVNHVSSSWLYRRPIIALGSEIDELTREQLLDAGVRVLITKPFNPVELVRKIDEIIA